MTAAKGTSAQYANRRELAIAQGTWRPYVDAAPAVAHVAMLRRAGVSVRGIAVASGLGFATVSRLTYPVMVSPNSPGVRPTTARAVLAVRVLDAPDWCLIRNTGTVRRIQGLQRLGWRLQDIGDRIGVSRSAVYGFGLDERISARNARRVAAVYDELSMAPGPSIHSARRLAHVPPPLAWDDDEIDDPAATPHTTTAVDDDAELDEVLLERLLAGEPITVIRARRAPIISALTARGLTAKQIADLISVTSRTVVRHRTSARQHQPQEISA